MSSVNFHETQKTLSNFCIPAKFNPDQNIKFNIKFVAYHHFILLLLSKLYLFSINFFIYNLSITQIIIKINNLFFHLQMFSL